MTDEVLEGQYDFSKYEELIEYAARLDLGIYLGLTCEQAPGWLYQKHPDCRMVGRDGRAIVYEAQATTPADGKPGPCFDHPGAMSDQLRFIRRMVETLGRYENLNVWNTWQEIAYWPERLTGQHVCYCENTLAAFRRWLEEKYGDLDGLNRAWNTRYGDWRFVQPDRGAYQANALPQDVDWRYFMDNVQIAQILQARCHTIRESDPLKRPVFAHKSMADVGWGKDWTYARCQDFFGSSCYPAWWPFHPWDDSSPVRGRTERTAALLAEMWSYVAMNFDYIRSATPPGKPVWAAEFQGGPISTFLHKGRVPTPEDIRRWILTAVGSGVTGLVFWVTRAEIMAQEMSGFSLLDNEGETSPRLQEAARVGSALNRHADLFGQPSSPRAEVAILINEWNAQFCNTCPPAGDHLAYSTRGWHRLLWQSGIPVDFLEASELDEPYAGKYKVIIMPYPLSISEQIASKLVNYVQDGGNLVSEAGPGRIDEHGFCNRGELSSVLRELFGVCQTGFSMVREPEDGRRWSPVERTWGEYLEPAILEGFGLLRRQRVRANVYIETFAPQGSEVCLQFSGQAAGVVRKVKSGSAWLLGTYIGHCGTAYRDEDAPRFVKALMAECGALPAHSGQLLLRKRCVPGKEAWIFTNPTDHSVTENVKVGDYQLIDLFGDRIECSGGEVSIALPSLDVRILILTSTKHR